MKYAIGDWLAVRRPGDTFLAVYVAGIRGPQYDIALTDHRGAVAPGESVVDDCLLLAVEIVLEDSSFSGLDVVVMGEAYVDGSDDIGLIRHWPLPADMGVCGLERVMDTGELGAYVDRELALRAGSGNGLGLRKYLVGAWDLFEGVPPPDPFPLVKLYRVEGETVFCWQIYGSAEPALLVVREGPQEKMEEQVIGDRPIAELEKEYAMLIDDKKWEGYQELYLLLPRGGEG